MSYSSDCHLRTLRMISDPRQGLGGYPDFLRERRRTSSTTSTQNIVEILEAHRSKGREVLEEHLKNRSTSTDDEDLDMIDIIISEGDVDPNYTTRTDGKYPIHIATERG